MLGKLEEQSYDLHQESILPNVKNVKVKLMVF
jgi:hypothetical protein